jgi:hypothetical protein
MVNVDASRASDLAADVVPGGSRPGTSDQPTEVLFPEAKRRECHRRLGVALAALVAAGGLAATVVTVSGLGAVSGAPTLAHIPGGSPLTVADASAIRGHGDLAFVSLGVLFVLDGSTGKTVAVTDPRAEASEPSFSPNGQWLTYMTTGSNTSTYWLARADGSDARRLAGEGTWQRDGQLAVLGRSSLSSTYVVDPNGTLQPTGTISDRTYALVDGAETIYVDFVNTLKIAQPSSSTVEKRGVEEIETSQTPNGLRTLWYSSKVSFTGAGGLEGTFIDAVGALPDGRGLLLTINRYCCDYADGVPLYELTSPGGRPHLLDTVPLTAPPASLGPNGTFAIAGGSNRDAWVNKHVDLCDAATATCRHAPAPSDTLTVSPAWSPNGRTLAYVEAKPEAAGKIGQAQIAKWYATHHLYLLSAGSTTPVEVPGTAGAMEPVWSSDSKSLMFVRNDDLFLVAKRGAKPVEVAGPLFHPTGWWSNNQNIAQYGSIRWNTQFAWSQGGS